MNKKIAIFLFLCFIGLLLPYDIGKYNMYSAKTYKIINSYAYRNGKLINVNNLEDYLFHRKIIDEAHPIIYENIMSMYLDKFIIKENLDSIYVIFNKPKSSFEMNGKSIELIFKSNNGK